MANQILLLIRHADKPETAGPQGVEQDGQPDQESLIPRGWHRAGIWLELFCPSLGEASVLPKPAAIFASAPATLPDRAKGLGGSKSKRPLQTVQDLAAKAGLVVDLRFGRGQESDLAAAIIRMDGVVLVSWQHEAIVEITDAIAPGNAAIPRIWPKECYNVVFKFTRTTQADPWIFEQLVPVMLPGDRSSPLPTS